MERVAETVLVSFFSGSFANRNQLSELKLSPYTDLRDDLRMDDLAFIDLADYLSRCVVFVSPTLLLKLLTCPVLSC